MNRLVSLGTKVKQIHGLRGTKDVSEWEDKFIESVYAWSAQGECTTGLTEKQIAVIDRIWEQHFA